VAGGGSLRIGYPTARLYRGLDRTQRRRIRRRSLLLLTTSRRYQVSGIRPGSSTRALRSRLRGERRLRVGRDVWYLDSANGSRWAIRTRGRRVLEIGIVNKRLSTGRLHAKRLLRAWRL